MLYLSGMQYDYMKAGIGLGMAPRKLILLRGREEKDDSESWSDS